MDNKKNRNEKNCTVLYGAFLTRGGGAPLCKNILMICLVPMS